MSKPPVGSWDDLEGAGVHGHHPVVPKAPSDVTLERPVWDTPPLKSKLVALPMRSGLAVKEILESVLRYYRKTKGVGHTRALFTGLGFLSPLSNLRPTVVAHDEMYGRMISNGNSVGLENFPQFSLKSNVPILWDNGALVTLLAAALNRIEELEADSIAVADRYNEACNARPPAVTYEIKHVDKDGNEKG